MSSVSLTPYIYTPLRTLTSIRLIQLLPGKEGSQLRCNIFQICRKRIASFYEALSYAWGDPHFTRRLNEAATNTVICITENLYHALQGLRHGDTSRWLWVDAVCIAQGNILEKNHQVRQMAEIYRGAKSVLVWTGNDWIDNCWIADGSFDRDWSYVDWTECDWTGNNWTGSGGTRTGILSTLADIYESHQEELELRSARGPLDLSIPTDLRTIRRNIGTIEGFLCRQWFCRVWTVQEFVLAKDIQIHVGRTSMNYPLFSIPIRACDAAKYRSPDHFFPNIARLQKLMWLRDIYTRDMSPPIIHPYAEPRLHKCLSVLDNRQCTNEVDKFYSIHGLLNGDFDISPNYDLSLFDVRMDVTKKLLLTGDLSTLDSAETFRDTNIPNSVPSFLIRIPNYRHTSHWGDTSVEFQPAPVGSDECRSMLINPVKFEGPSFNDTGPLTIGLQGTDIDRVVELIFCEESDDKLSCDETLLDRYFRPSFVPNLRAIFDYLLESRFKHRKSPHSECGAFERCFWHTINLGSPPGSKRFESDIIAYLLRNFGGMERIFSRVFFVTECGLFGLCSRWTRVGDHMVFFQGSKKPHMLRPAVSQSGEKIWRLIGDCYVDNSLVGNFINFDCNDNSRDGVEESSGPQHGPNAMPRKRLFAEQFILC